MAETAFSNHAYELQQAQNSCVIADIEGVPTALRLAETPVCATSRTKQISMNNLCLVDDKGDVRAILGPATGTIAAESLPGNTIWHDIQAIRTMQQALRANEIHRFTSPIPFAQVTASGYEQQAIPLGHSLHEVFDVIAQNADLLPEPLPQYQAIHVISKVLGAIKILHQLHIKHGDIGQYYHMRNALYDMFADKVYIIDYSHSRVVKTQDKYSQKIVLENDIFSQEKASATGRVKKLLEAAGLADLVKAGLGNYYEQEEWRANTLQQKALEVLQAHNLPFQATNEIRDYYVYAYLHSIINSQGVTVPYYQLPQLRSELRHRYNSGTTLQLF